MAGRVEPRRPVTGLRRPERPPRPVAGWVTGEVEPSCPVAGVEPRRPVMGLRRPERPPMRPVAGPRGDEAELRTDRGLLARLGATGGRATLARLGATGGRAAPARLDAIIGRAAGLVGTAAAGGLATVTSEGVWRGGQDCHGELARN